MNVIEAMEARHSVRSYQNKPIEEEKRKALEELARKCNAESGLNIQLCFDEEEAFQGMMAHYGKFHNVRNYIALVGKKDDRLDETCGYYGEQLVLKATELGLSTCWVAMTDRKRRTGCVINKGEKLCCVIALGYGENEGVPHQSKRIEEVCDVEGELPAWFAQGVRCALLAPTAMNQQKFRFTLREGRVSLRASFGPYTKVDLGIVRCHFALGAGKGDWQWAEDER